MSYYVPIMLDVEDLPVLVLGGGNVAARKVKPLIEGRAAITVISPELCIELIRMHAVGSIRWISRSYEAGDIAACKPSLVFVCTGDQEINAAAGLEANRLNVAVNVTSAAEQGNFITPSVVRRGGLILSVSASGGGPAVSRNIARDLENRYGSEYELYTAAAAAVRQRVKASVPDPDRRSILLRRFAELDLLEQIRSGQYIPWTEEQIDEWIVKG